MVNGLYRLFVHIATAPTMANRWMSTDYGGREGGRGDSPIYETETVHIISPLSIISIDKRELPVHPPPPKWIQCTTNGLGIYNYNKIWWHYNDEDVLISDMDGGWWCDCDTIYFTELSSQYRRTTDMSQCLLSSINFSKNFLRKKFFTALRVSRKDRSIFILMILITKWLKCWQDVTERKTGKTTG